MLQVVGSPNNPEYGTIKLGEDVIVESYGLPEIQVGEVIPRSESHTLVIKPKRHGTILRVFKRQGVTYYATMGKLVGPDHPLVRDYYRWGGKELGEGFSCLFSIVDPLKVRATRQWIEVGCVIQLGGSYIAGLNTVPNRVTKSMLYTDMELNFTIDEGEKFLKWGYYQALDGSEPSSTLAGGVGEAIEVFYLDQEGCLERYLELRSNDYDKRSFLLEQSDNVRHRFYSLFDIDTAKLVGLDDPGDEELDQNAGSIFHLYLADVSIDRRQIWLNLFLALPPFRQVKETKTYKQYQEEMQLVESEVEKTIKDNRLAAGTNYLGALVGRVKRLVKERFRSHRVFRKDGTRYGYEELLLKTAKNLIAKEGGTRLYRLVEELKKRHHHPAGCDSPN